MELTRSNLEQFFQSVDFAFRDAQQTVPTFWKTIAKQVPSKTEKNVYPWMGEIPGLREWFGERVVNNVATRDYSLTNKHYEDTVGLDRVKLEDDTYGFFTDIVGALGKRVAEFVDEKVSSTLEAGTSTLCWDGQYFFDTDHPVDPDDSSKGTFSNLLKGAGYSLAADPKAAFSAARKAMMKFTRDDGKPLGVVGNILMVPPDLEDAALVAVESDLISQKQLNVAGSENVSNAAVSNVYKGKATVIVNPWLSDTDDWYLFCTTRGIMPMLYQLRQPANFVPRVDPSSDNVFRQKRYEWGVDLRAAFGYTFPQLAIRLGPA
jgi:phage major head subunit gpT-like protein